MTSKMLDAYVNDIGLFLREEGWDEAEQRATGLPHIAVALGTPELASSQAAYRLWCREWVRPEPNDAVTDTWFAVSTQNPFQFIEGKPVAVLQALSLSRRLRASAPPPPRVYPTTPRGTSVTQTCNVLISAFQAWHNNRGRTDATVALNLGKLGVLR
jgi:hypothetical protein